MDGLLDQYTHAGNEQAFTVVKGMAGWVQRNVEATLARGGMTLWQQVLGTECVPTHVVEAMPAIYSGYRSLD